MQCYILNLKLVLSYHKIDENTNLGLLAWWQLSAFMMRQVKFKRFLLSIQSPIFDTLLHFFSSKFGHIFLKSINVLKQFNMQKHGVGTRCNMKFSKKYFRASVRQEISFQKDQRFIFQIHLLHLWNCMISNWVLLTIQMEPSSRPAKHKFHGK